MRKKVLISTVLMVIVASTTALAWGAKGTITVGGGQGWVTYKQIKDTKEGDANDWAYEVYNKTMWSNPTAKLVNSNGEERSATASLTNGKTMNASRTWTTKWYEYYLSVKPAWNQSGNDTVTLDIDLK